MRRYNTKCTHAAVLVIGWAADCWFVVLIEAREAFELLSKSRRFVDGGSFFSFNTDHKIKNWLLFWLHGYWQKYNLRRGRFFLLKSCGPR